MKRFLLSAAVLGVTVSPALAGGGGADTGVGTVLVQAVAALAAKLAGLF
jgi:hypothetical protein